MLYLSLLDLFFRKIRLFILPCPTSKETFPDSAKLIALLENEINEYKNKITLLEKERKQSYIPDW